MFRVSRITRDNDGAIKKQDYSNEYSQKYRIIDLLQEIAVKARRENLSCMFLVEGTVDCSDKSCIFWAKVYENGTETVSLQGAVSHDEEAQEVFQKHLECNEEMNELYSESTCEEFRYASETADLFCVFSANPRQFVTTENYTVNESWKDFLIAGLK